MPAPPVTEYAIDGDVHIAYQTLGDGPRDVVFLPEFFGHLELLWEQPRVTRFLRRLATFSRLILFDKRGTGLSDPVPLAAPLSLEQWMDDVRIVMDATESDQAALFGHSAGAAISMLYAATYPTRTSELIIYSGFARLFDAPGYEMGIDRGRFESVIDSVYRGWGTGALLQLTSPTEAADIDLREWAGKLERNSVSPGAFRGLMRMGLTLDVRGVLPAIHTPTLVLHRAGNAYMPREHGQYLAAHIPGCRYVELAGTDDEYFLGDSEALLDEVEEFLTGTRETSVPDRVLATLLFTDLVRSTERMAAVGDRSWLAVVERHHEVVRQQLKRYRGREIDTAGDGFLATFDGPARAIRCGIAVRDAVLRLGLDIRVGIHTGECEMVGEKFVGMAVHTAARVMTSAGENEVLVSRTVVDLVAGSGIGFTDRGDQVLKGVPGTWSLYAVDDSTIRY